MKFAPGYAGRRVRGLRAPQPPDGRRVRAQPVPRRRAGHGGGGGGRRGGGKEGGEGGGGKVRGGEGGGSWPEIVSNKFRGKKT